VEVIAVGLFDRWRRGGGGGSGNGVGGNGVRQVLDREATGDDLDHLRRFARSRTGVEFYVEPETTATDTTVVAVAQDGEWTRRRCGSPKAAGKLARKLGVPVYDVTVTGYPESMRRWNERAKADKKILDRMQTDLDP
jgi:hypothetical protein